MAKIAVQVPLICIVLAVFCAPRISLAEDGDRPYLKDVDSFFEMLADKKGDEAILDLYKDSPYASAMTDAINNVAFQLAGLNRVYGDYRNHEVLIHEVVIERYAYLMYFVSFDRQPFKFEFHFYRPDDEWQFQKFGFSDEIDSDIVEAAKLGLIRNFPF